MDGWIHIYTHTHIHELTTHTNIPKFKHVFQVSLSLVYLCFKTHFPWHMIGLVCYFEFKYKFYFNTIKLFSWQSVLFVLFFPHYFGRMMYFLLVFSFCTAFILRVVFSTCFPKNKKFHFVHVFEPGEPYHSWECLSQENQGHVLRPLCPQQTWAAGQDLAGGSLGQKADQGPCVWVQPGEQRREHHLTQGNGRTRRKTFIRLEVHRTV